MQIDSIPEMLLTARDEAGIAALLAVAYAEYDDDNYSGRTFYKQRHHMRIVARDAGQVVGHLALLFRDVRLGGKHFPIVGVAEVGTDPDHRGKGIASALLTQTITQAKQSLAEFIILFGDKGLYTGHGFQQMPNPLRYVALDDVRTHKIITRTDENLMILPLQNTVWDPDATLDLVGHIF